MEKSSTMPKKTHQNHIAQSIRAPVSTADHQLINHVTTGQSTDHQSSRVRIRPSTDETHEHITTIEHQLIK